MSSEAIVPTDIFAIYFSGFSAHAIEIEGVLYPTLEHAYHCLRFEDKSVAEEIRLARSPEIAWELAQKYKPQRMKLNDEEKIAMMTFLTRAKIEQHADVRAMLQKTNGLLIVKRIIAGPPGDGFWDIGDGEGANEWGKIWMRLRDEIAMK